MQITWGLIVVWLIVGALAGSLAGMVVKRSKEGFGRVVNIGIGLVGALVGGFFFKIFNINLGLRNIVVSFEDLVEAFLGSLLFLLVLLFAGTELRSQSAWLHGWFSVFQHTTAYHAFPARWPSSVRAGGD